MNALDKMKTRLIRSEIARRNASDAETVELILESLTTVNDDGDIVGIASQGHRPLSAMLDELEQTNPNYFAKPATETAAAHTSVVTDPRAPGFNLSKALIAARSDPHLYQELMDRLAPKPVRF